ncbi:MAG: transposase [Candidatus Njordarchaeia archaeon]
MEIAILIRDDLTNETIIEKTKEILFGEKKRRTKCPYCGSRNIIRFGKLNNNYLVFRYRCKECNKTFNDLTGTPFERSKLEPKEIFMISFLHFNLGLNMIKISKIVGRPYKTVWKTIKSIEINHKSFMKRLLKSIDFEIDIRDL